MARADDVVPGPVTGDVIGNNFCVERKLGAGGMGVVYLAHDLRLRRRIALKLHSSSDGAQRIEREARVLASLQHPNVVTIHDVGTWGGRTYIAMEYLEGGNLRSWLCARPREWREILTIFIEAAHGLDAIHRAGLVHRDFKPDNVLIGSDGRVRIADFGLARPVRGIAVERTERGPGAAPASSDCATLTATGTPLGTPGYMAPEVERGDRADARADEYSFCVALGAALSGCRAPRWIAPILARGLHPDPAQRFASLGELVDALDRPPRARRRWIAPAILGVVIAGALWASTRPGAAISIPARVCPRPELPALHVDASAPPGGNGSVACPFRTLSQALAVPAGSRVVHVAAGRYDAEHGEKLPLVVRGATEIRGAGAEITTIAGFGYYDGRPDQLPNPYPQRVTLIVGDDEADVRLSGLSIESGRGDVTDGGVGILCTRGNLHGFEGPVPAPNTWLDRVIVGGGYETGLVVTGGASRLTGCNLSVTSGTFHDASTAIWQVGCGTGYAIVPTALAVTNSAFRGIRAKRNPTAEVSEGIAVLGWDCARSLRVASSIFTDSDRGIKIARHLLARHDPRDPPAVIDHNEFAALGRYAIRLEFAVQVELSRNRIWGTPAGVAIYTHARQPPLIRARDNRFENNVVAVDIEGSDPLPRDSVIDFGRAGDPGGNIFSCNAVEANPSTATVTVGVRTAPGGSLTFAGNQWDHAPPRVRRGPAHDRADVRLAADPAAVDVGDPLAFHGICMKTGAAPR